jgi:hypothetical protein
MWFLLKGKWPWHDDEFPSAFVGAFCCLAAVAAIGGIVWWAVSFFGGK